MEVTKRYRTETGHRLMDYNGKCAHLHGHSYVWEVTALDREGLTNNGMVVDFKDLKTVMKSVLEPLDHAMVLRYDDPLVAWANSQGISTGKLLRPPKRVGGEGRLYITDFNPTAENLARVYGEYMSQRLQEYTGGTALVSHVRLWETADSHADWSNPNVR